MPKGIKAMSENAKQTDKHCKLQTQHRSEKIKWKWVANAAKTEAPNSVKEFVMTNEIIFVKKLASKHSVAKQIVHLNIASNFDQSKHYHINIKKLA